MPLFKKALFYFPIFLLLILSPQSQTVTSSQTIKQSKNLIKNQKTTTSSVLIGAAIIIVTTGLKEGAHNAKTMIKIFLGTLATISILILFINRLINTLPKVPACNSILNKSILEETSIPLPAFVGCMLTGTPHKKRKDQKKKKRKKEQEETENVVFTKWIVVIMVTAAVGIILVKKETEAQKNIAKIATVSIIGILGIKTGKIISPKILKMISQF